MIVLLLMLAGGAALVITGIVQGRPGTAIFGGVVLVFLLWGLATGGSGDDDDCGDAGDGDA
ncbi:hypothetical protein [Amycolatopsis sp.]|uniref:hypothetical protein n=1 Tax=Amycolatopsis sp. TaxID=37632 RepID=UPI002D7F9750|nr:hypothetical protein [Amycolatopsis sp.]HET6704883.1 hypothetical protein [Amycolatopsis sp.]